MLSNADSQPLTAFQEFRDQLMRDFQVVGASDAFQSVLEQIFVVAPHNVTILLIGETGTGKELIARTIHALGSSSSRPFVPVDCAAIPESLFADELFGHARGAFTDARDAAPGLLASAAGGTLFLDEIESLGVKAQGTLLRLLDERQWRALGSRDWQRLDARIVVATNEDLNSLIERGQFRRDLYFRLAGEICKLPPLRERREDIAPLARHFVASFAKQHEKKIALSAGALGLLAEYSWPGNVRELRHCLQRTMRHAKGDTLEAVDLLSSLSVDADVLGGSEPSVSSWREARQRAIDTWEKQFLSEQLAKPGSNLSEIADRLGLSRMQFYRLLKKHDLRPGH
jgi:DNA-binding NtrC family response regulator